MTRGLLPTAVAALLVFGLPVAATAVDPPVAAEAAHAHSRLVAASEYEKGLAYACGRGVPRDLAQAAKWFRSAAENGHPQAQSAIGWMLMTGRGVARNDTEAARWLQQAAQHGVVPAQNNLGVLYVIGQGVPHDHAIAERWFRAAAEQGAIDAQKNLDTLLSRNPPVAAPVAAVQAAVIRCLSRRDKRSG